MRQQVEPHFLFNTLANVQALVESGSPREQLHPLRLPPMTLLTLVENAVRHGIDPSERGGQIASPMYVTRGLNETADVYLEGCTETLPVSRSFLHLFWQM